jgi:hypothetical protein
MVLSDLTVERDVGGGVGQTIAYIRAALAALDARQVQP